MITWSGVDSTLPKRSELTMEQRREAVQALLRREEPAALLARRHGISEQTLYLWRDHFLVAGQTALAQGKNDVDAREQQIRVPHSKAIGSTDLLGKSESKPRH